MICPGQFRRSFWTLWPNELEIQLPSRQIGGDQFYAHGVPERVFLFGALAHQGIIFLHVVVKIIAERAHAHEALGTRRFFFHIKAPLSHAGDDALECLAHFVLHVFDQLISYRFTFGVDRLGLLLACRYAQGFEVAVLAPIYRRAIKMTFEYTVHQYVWIAAYRRSKVCIVLKCEAEVPDIFGRVYSLGHRA